MKITGAGALNTVKAVGYGAAFLAVGYVAYKAYKLFSKPGAFNPTSDQNLAYQGANSIVQNLPGGTPQDTVGTYLYGLFHSDPAAQYVGSITKQLPPPNTPPG